MAVGQSKKRTFEEWMKDVNRAVYVKLGLTTEDLPDCCYRDWYDEGASPKSAAARALRNAEEG